MSAFTVFIPGIIVVAVVVIVRRFNLGGGFQRPRLDANPLLTAPGRPAPRLLPLPGDVALVAARELRERVRSRAFRVASLLVLVVVAAAIAIPALLGGGQRTARVGVAGPLSAATQAALVADGTASGVTVSLVPEPSAQAADTGLRDGRIALAVVGGRQVVTDQPVAAAATSAAAQFSRAAARTVGTSAAAAAAGLTPAQAAAVAAAGPAPLSSLQPAGPGTTRRAASLVGLLLVFFMLTQYNAWTLTGVLEEKSSRVVEVLLAAITPGRLLAGKVLGIGLAAFGQVVVTVALAVAVARSTHSGALSGLTPLSVAATASWLILGYAFYSWLYAAAGATANRQEQAQSLLLPLGLPAILGYIAATTAATSGSPSTLVHVLAYLPPTAPFAMPVLISLGAATWWQFAVSAAVSVACTIGVARVAVAVYRGSILRTGRRVPLRELVAAARRG